MKSFDVLYDAALDFYFDLFQTSVQRPDQKFAMNGFDQVSRHILKLSNSKVVESVKYGQLYWRFPIQPESKM